jgi:hypothetical protein
MLHEIVFDLQLFRRDRPKPRGVFEGASVPPLPKTLARVLDIRVDVVSEMNEKVGVEFQDCIPDRLSSHNRKVKPLHSSIDMNGAAMIDTNHRTFDTKSLFR